MRRFAWVLLLASAACSEDSSEATAEAAAAEAPPPEPADDLAELIAARESLVIAKKKETQDERRQKCLEVEPKIEAWSKGKATKKREENLSQVRGLCGEAIETRRLMKKAAEPAPEINLSPALQKVFSSKAMAQTFKKAKKAARRGDPQEHCDRALLTARYLEAKGKLKKKDRKLIKKTKSFCQGKGAVATIKFRLKAAEVALAEGKAMELSEHCVAVVTTLRGAQGKLSRYQEMGDKLCLEANAMKSLLDPA